MKNVISGKVHKFGDNINTDIISPPQYIELTVEEAAVHSMEALDPEFGTKFVPGELVVAGANFGSGSSRETSPLALKYLGCGAVVAKYFARIFYRNALNIGLPVLESPAAAAAIAAGDEVEVDFDSGEIRDLTSGETFASAPIPPFMQEILADGGLIAHVRKQRA